MSNTKQSNSRGYVTGLVIAIISVAITALLLVNRQFIIDQVHVWQYEPTAEISAFAERAQMSEKGTFLFYASQPSLEGAQTFNGKCSRVEKSAAILGCYNGRSIYIYDVTDPKLDGIREVTAAHEMLHAVYTRLSSEERTKVDALLEDEYDKLKNQADFSERMAFYARTEPGERNNELHSIIGTEVLSISSELEKYYKAYFDDRKAVVRLHEQYAAVFASLQIRSEALSRELSALADSIERNTANYNAAVSQLNDDISRFNERTSNGDFTSQEQFDRERAALVARANGLDSQRAAIDSERQRYNTLREELVTIASESEALNRSIDSSLAPAPSL